jgi:glycosyltransferase involved in cell wall biosynthesis
MKLSVIVPCLDAANTLAAQLDALCRQRWEDDWEVIVVDNGSTDGSQEIVKRYRRRLPHLRLIEATARRGAAHVRNIGVEVASGEAIVFCDADDEVDDHWLAALGNALSRYDFVASRMDVKKLNPARIADRLNNVQGYELRRTFYPPYLRHAGSSGLGIKRAIHDSVGGFDESLLQREDTDYCFRVQHHGTDLHFEPAAVIHVRYSEKSHKLFRQARLWARYHALLYNRYGNGMPLEGAWRAYLRTWRDLIRCSPRIFSTEKRPAWMKTLGTQIGLLEGSIRYGVPPICDLAAATVVDLTESSVVPGVDEQEMGTLSTSSAPALDTARAACRRESRLKVLAVRGVVVISKITGIS